MKSGFWKAAMSFTVTIFLFACGGGDGGETIIAGSSSPGGVVIQSITADPPVVRPGQNTTLAVSANGGAGNTLTYVWSSTQGNLTSTGTSTTTWTAPNTVGSCLVTVQVSDGTFTATGYATVLVSVSPSGPIITNVSPSQTRSGDTISITGAGFGAAQGSSTVTIGGVASTSIVSWSENLVKAVVPSGATTGSVIITESGMSSSPGYITLPWSEGNARLTDTSMNEWYPDPIPDGAGGAIIVWFSERTGGFDIYAQRVDRTGAAQWATDGVAVSTATSNQQSPTLVSDGMGGAIIAWEDWRDGNWDIYAQRVNSAGTAQWTENGVAISTGTGQQESPRMISDGAGGAIITWQSNQSGNYDIYACRVNGAGTLQWYVAISTATGDQEYPEIVPDGSGGVIIAWQDYRGGNYDIYAQRVNSAGSTQWIANGIGISTAAGNQTGPTLTSDGSGGAIIAWADDRNGNYDIYAQRVNSAGNAQWIANGVGISTAAGNQWPSLLTSDGSGGALFSWDFWNGNDYDVYAQKVNSAGSVQWGTNGVVVCPNANNQNESRIISDGTGGAIVAWTDSNGSMNDEIYAQRLNSDGMAQWGTAGVRISTGTDNARYPLLTSDGQDGVIITWGGDWDVYAQRVNGSGQW